MTSISPELVAMDFVDTVLCGLRLKMEGMDPNRERFYEGLHQAHDTAQPTDELFNADRFLFRN